MQQILVQAVLRVLALVAIVLFFTACGSSGGPGQAGNLSPTMPVVDATPHDYAFEIENLNSASSSAHFQIVCNLGLPSERIIDTVGTIVLPDYRDTVGCGAASNVIAKVTSNGVSAGLDETYVEVWIDGVQIPALETVLHTGQQFTFERGF